MIQPGPDGEKRYPLSSFSLSDMLDCAAAIRALGDGAVSMEDVARRICHWFHDRIVDDDGSPACNLVRLYKTQEFQGLPPDLQAFARETSGLGNPAPTLRCLTLLGTAGLDPTWNDRRYSSCHRAISLPSEEVVRRSPMIAQLIAQMGLSVGDAIAPASNLGMDRTETTFNVFHVAEAAGSPHIPAQDFVQRYGIRSVLGFGGLLPNGDLFAVILFSKVSITRETAEKFRSLALSAKLALLPLTMGPIFDPSILV